MAVLFIFLAHIGLITTLCILCYKIIEWRHEHHEFSQKKRFTIAILSPTNKAPNNALSKSFVSYLKKYASFEFETLECITNSDQEKTYQWAEYLATSNVDLIYSVGRRPTEVLYNSLKTRTKKIPVIAGGIPADHCEPSPDIIQREIPFTATTGSFNWPKKVALMQKALPHLKKVMILFRSIDELSHINLKEKNNITMALRKHHIAWEMHHINNIENSTEITPELLKDIDLVIIARTGELIPYAAQISKDCDKANVPVFSTDALSPNIFLGIAESTEKSHGEVCAKHAMQILEDGKNASNIPTRQIVGPHDVVIFPDNAVPLTATTTIGNATSNATYVKMNLKS